MKILLISDKADWAYSSIAEEIIKHCTAHDFTHVSCKGNKSHIKKIYKQFDYYFVIGWQNYSNISFLDCSKTMVGVHSYQSLCAEKGKYMDISYKKCKNLNRFLSVNTVSHKLYDELNNMGIITHYTPNGVDTSTFNHNKKDYTSIIVGSVGSLKNDWNKGIQSIIKPACESMNIEYSFQILEKNRVKHINMPKYYESINCFICASITEGMSMSVLEAASSGCIIISTNCGDISTIIEDGQNGLICNRNVHDVCNKLECINEDSELCTRLDKNMHNTILNEWTWERNMKEWSHFINSSIESVQ